MTREELITDRLFVQEIMNDLAKRGLKYTKAWSLLRDWSRELKQKSFMTGKTKKRFYEIVGKENY